MAGLTRHLQKNFLGTPCFPKSRQPSPETVLPFQILQAYGKLARVVFLTNKRRTRAFLTHLRQQGFEIDALLEKRIYAYTVQSSLTNSWFSGLAGKPITTRQAELALYLGALTPVSDNLTDDAGLTYAQVLGAVQQIAPDSPPQIKLAAYLNAEMEARANGTFRHYKEKTLRAQDASLAQLGKERLDAEVLRQITFDKGGYSTLLYRSMVEAPFRASEEEAVYMLGSVLQLTNDAFDVYKDFSNGQQTLFTNTRDIQSLETLYLAQVKEMMTAFRSLNYPSQKITQALAQILIVVSRGVLSIRQLLSCQKTTGGVFELEAYLRQQLICDMEKPSNILQSVQISKRLLKGKF